MKLDFSGERVLAIVVHPDDAEMLCAGTLARAKADGAGIGIAVMCSGNAGQPEKPIQNLAAVRRREMEAAAKLLGAELYRADIDDGTLTDDRRTRLRVVEIQRQFRPTLVLAHSLNDYHGDHRAAGALAEVTSWSCASHGVKTKSPPLPRPPALWWMDTVNMSGFALGFYVDISACLEVKEKMLACHRSQLARGSDSDFSPLLDLMRLQAHARGAQAGIVAAEAFCAHHAFKRERAW